MNYQKLTAALNARGIAPDRAHELANWWCYAPRGTPYPHLYGIAFNKAYVEAEHPRDERGRWTFKDGSGSSSSSSGSESPAKRKALEELNGDICAALGECYSNDLEKWEKAKTAEEREHYREKINEEIRMLLEYGEDYEWEDSEFADVARETKKRLAEEKRKKEMPKPPEKPRSKTPKDKPEPGTKIDRKNGGTSYRKETREEQVDRLLKEREEAEHFAQRYANNEELRKRYERAVREYDRQLDALGVE